MRLHHTLFLFLLVLPAWSYAYELVSIQAVSDTKRSFVTRNGKRQGVVQGMTGTFTAQDISILARARTVTGQFTQWEIINPEAIVPWEKGELVTWSAAQEYLWALAPEKERQKYIKSIATIPRRSWLFKGALTRGLSESVSGVEAQETRRGGYLGEVYFEKFFTQSLSFDAGFRYEREVVNYTGVSYTTNRSMLIADILYYFNVLSDFLNDGRFFVGAGLGFGLSSTTSNGVTQSGPVSMLPGVKVGVSLPFNDDWEFVLDTAFESLQTKEKQDVGIEQTTTQTNLKVGFGLRRFF